MGWQGINLTSYHQKEWAKKSIKHLILTCLFFSITSVSSIVLYLSSKNIQKNEQEIVIKNKKIQQDIDVIQNEILKIQNHNKNKGDNHNLSQNNVMFLLHYIRSFEVQGSINSIQLYIDGMEKIKIFGNLNHQNEFKYIEKQLENLSYRYQLDHLQTNEAGQIEFGFTINLGEENEKHTH